MGYNSKYGGAQVEALLDASLKMDFVQVSSSTISSALVNTCYIITQASAGAVVVSALATPTGVESRYSFRFSGATSLTIPSSVKWVNGEKPTIDSSASYELSIVASKFASGWVYKGVLAKFL